MTIARTTFENVMMKGKCKEKKNKRNQYIHKYVKSMGVYTTRKISQHIRNIARQLFEPTTEKQCAYL